MTALPDTRTSIDGAPVAGIKKPGWCAPSGLLLLALLLPGAAGAYEAEDAVPLTLGAVFGKLRLEKLSVKLSGRDVEIAVTVRNNEPTRQPVGLFAYTPIFQQLGMGEEHADKSFQELDISFAGRHYPRPGLTRRGYFMGQDITAALGKAGIGALPDSSVTYQRLAKVKFPFGLRAEDWEGQVAYAWTGQMAPHAIETATVRYRALPQFGIDNLDAPEFRRQLQQHCGDPDQLIPAIVKQNGGSEQVMTERFDLPITFMKMEDVALEVVQPATNWLGAHPIVSLVCGVPSAASQATFAGTLANAYQRISVLVVSRMATAGEGGLAEELRYRVGNTPDAGKTWRSLKQDDPLLKRVTAAWLEGQKRIAKAAPATAVK